MRLKTPLPKKKKKVVVKKVEKQVFHPCKIKTNARKIKAKKP
jgi:hypothetical protein